MSDEKDVVTKKWFMSKGVIGSLIVAGTAICKLVGLDIDINIEGMEEEILTLVGAVTALWGRVTAKTKLV